MATSIILLTLALLSTPALAGGEVPPANSSSPVLVMWPTGDGIYYPLPAGSELTYVTPGPVKLVVEIRRRIPGSGKGGEGSEIEAYGDGHLILRIKSTRGPVPSGSLNDGSKAIPSEPDIARFTVPAGGKVLALRAPASGPDFLVRVNRDDDGTAPTMATAAEPVVDDVPILDEEAELRSFADDDEPDDDFVAIPRDEPAAEPAPAKSSPADDHPGYDVIDMTRARRSAGPVLGLGGPTRGDTAVLYLGARARLPVIEDLLDAGVGLGWYRFSVDREIAVTDPYLGSYPLPVTWRTGVVPITADAIFDLPLDLGVVQPVAGAGLGLYIASRLEDGQRTTGATLGTQWFAGADIDAGPGDVGISLGWNLARRKFGNPTPDGEESREALSTFRIDTTYQFRF